MMKRVWLTALSILVITVTLLVSTGCTSGGTTTPSVQNGTLTFMVTDAPPRPDVSSIMITISKVEVHKAVAEQEQTQTGIQGQTQSKQQVQQREGEWLSINIPAEAQTFDLMKIKGIEQLLTSTQVATGKYTQVRLTVEKAEVTLSGGTPQPATVPSDVLKLVHPFDIVAGEITTLTMDFDADKSVNVTGNDKIHIKPVIKLMVRPPKGPNPSEVTKEQSQKIAEDFVKNSPTFVFDGMMETLELMETKVGTCVACWQFVFEYDSRQAGYGDRTGQMLAQVITHHQAVITIEQGSVTIAVLDGKWNELTQEEIAQSTTQ